MKRIWKERLYIFIELTADKLFYAADNIRLYRLADAFDRIAEWAYLRWLMLK